MVSVRLLHVLHVNNIAKRINVKLLLLGRLLDGVLGRENLVQLLKSAAFGFGDVKVNDNDLDGVPDLAS
jgi:hypothetical protein